MKIFIDTQLWIYAFKRPQKEKFTSNEEYEDSLQMHEKAIKFIHEALLSHNNIYYYTSIS